MTELTREVRRRAGDRCEYCLNPQVAFRRPFHIEHIVARKHGGATQLDNLALACWHCNFKKGPNLAGLDPETAQMEPLFHPRKHKWANRFVAHVGGLMPLGIEIRGLTPVGRATVRVLGLNEEIDRADAPVELWLEGVYSGPS